MVKNQPASAGDLGLILRLGRSPGRRNGNLLQYSCLEKSHEQRSRTGYSPWDRRESDTAKKLKPQKFVACAQKSHLTSRSQTAEKRAVYEGLLDWFQVESWPWPSPAS